MDDITILGPQPGPQMEFAKTSAFIAICGGSFFGGKSVSVLMEAGRNIDHPQYRGVVFRRTYPQITDAGGLADIASILYPQYGGVPKNDRCLWSFPSGSQIKFNHLQYDADILNYRSSQFSFLGIDQVEEFSQESVFYLIARTRPSPGYDRGVYCRFSCNPEPGWLANLISWYWNPETGYPIKERSGIIRHYTNVGGGIKWVDKNYVGANGGKPVSFTFVPSTMFDNTAGLKNDPGYVSRVSALDPVAVERYVYGNWLVSYSGGMFDVKTFKKIKYSELPSGLKLMRYWDFAASEVKGNNDPDWSSGALCGTKNGDFYIVDIERFRENPGVTTAKVIECAQSDGIDVAIRWEEEKGSAGAFNTFHMSGKLLGYNANGDKVQGDKVERAKPLAEAAYNGHVYIVDAAWNSDFIAEAGTFPKKTRDMIDSVDGALKCLAIDKLVFPGISSRFILPFSIDWRSSADSATLYGSFYQHEFDGSFSFVTAIHDADEGTVFVLSSEIYSVLNISEITQNIVDRLRFKSIAIKQNTVIVCNGAFCGCDQSKKSYYSIISKKMDGYPFAPTMSLQYNEAGAVAIGNALIKNDSLYVHKSLNSLSSEIMRWSYISGKLAPGHLQCRALLYILSDIREKAIQKKEQRERKEYSHVIGGDQQKKEIQNWMVA